LCRKEAGEPAVHCARDGRHPLCSRFCGRQRGGEGQEQTTRRHLIGWCYEREIKSSRKESRKRTSQTRRMRIRKKKGGRAPGTTGSTGPVMNKTRHKLFKLAKKGGNLGQAWSNCGATKRKKSEGRKGKKTRPNQRCRERPACRNRYFEQRGKPISKTNMRLQENHLERRGKGRDERPALPLFYCRKGGPANQLTYENRD